MKKIENNDVMRLFADLQKQLSKNSITTNHKFKELKMMKFKIRPLQGDISVLNLRDKDLIETLWNLGKLDEFFQREYRHLKRSQKKMFYDIFEGLHQRYQDRLNELNLSTGRVNLSPVVEMEIYREELQRKSFN